MNEKKFTEEELNQNNPFQNIGTPLETLDNDQEIMQNNIQNNPFQNIGTPLETLNNNQAIIENDIQNNLMNPSYEVNNSAPTNTSYKDIYSYQQQIKDLEVKLKERKLAISIPAVFVLVVMINAAWFLGVYFLIQPKYEDAIKISEQMKKDYDSLKSKVTAIMGEE